MTTARQQATGQHSASPAAYARTLAVINRRAGRWPVVCLQIKSLAAELGVSRRTVSRHLAGMLRDRVLRLQRLHHPRTRLWTGWRVIFARRPMSHPVHAPAQETTSPRAPGGGRRRRSHDVWRRIAAGTATVDEVTALRTPVLRLVARLAAPLAQDGQQAAGWWLWQIQGELRRRGQRARLARTVRRRSSPVALLTTRPATAAAFAADAAAALW